MKLFNKMSEKSLFQTYKTTLYFILKFVGIYLLLVLLYNLYLSQFQGTTDSFTIFTGKMVSKLFGLIGMDAQTLPLEIESGLKLMINGNYVARIIEGCTAMSVIIMFVAFIISFGNRLKQSLIFALAGALLIYVFNLFRIVFLGVILYRLPQYQDVAHRIVFPAMIYGFVVLLWLIFIKKQKNV